MLRQPLVLRALVATRCNMKTGKNESHVGMLGRLDIEDSYLPVDVFQVTQVFPILTEKAVQGLLSGLVILFA